MFIKGADRNTQKADINSQLSCPINCRNWLPRIIVVPHKESKRPYRRMPRFSHHLKHDNQSVPRVFPDFWGTKNMGKTVFLPTWTFIRGPVPPLWNTQKAHMNSQLWCPINFRNWLISFREFAPSFRRFFKHDKSELEKKDSLLTYLNVYQGGRPPLYEIHQKLISTANYRAPSTVVIDCRVLLSCLIKKVKDPTGGEEKIRPKKTAWQLTQKVDR